MRNLHVFLVLIISFSVVAQKEDLITLKNATLHFTTYGKGLPIFIINGGPGMNSEGFAPLAKELGNSNLAIIYDQRGTGKSSIETISADTMTMDLMVEDIETIRKHLNIDKWIVLGHSFGGMLASYYVSKHPQHLRALILSSSGGIDLTLLSTLNLTSRLNSTEQDSLAHWNRKIAQGDTSYNALLHRGKYLANAYLYDDTYIDAVAERLTQGNMTINGLLWQNMQAINFDCTEQLMSFDKPVLIIQGKQDIIGPDIAEKAHQVFRDSEVVYIDKCAHYGWLEQPEAYFGNIKKFLNSLN